MCKYRIILYNLIILLILESGLTKGATITFVGPCSQVPLHTASFHIIDKSAVGDITSDILQKFNIPYLGTPQGFNSIFHTPTGLDAIEVINNYELLSYGWCYSINGVQPNDFPNNIMVKDDDNIRWWFGYAHYKNNTWLHQCVPSYQRKSNQFCKN